MGFPGFRLIKETVSKSFSSAVGLQKIILTQFWTNNFPAAEDVFLVCCCWYPWIRLLLKADFFTRFKPNKKS